MIGSVSKIILPKMGIELFTAIEISCLRGSVGRDQVSVGIESECINWTACGVSNNPAVSVAVKDEEIRGNTWVALADESRAVIINPNQIR